MPDEIHEHIQFIDRWLEQLGQIVKEQPSLSTEERKQLHAVNKAVEQLQRNGVPVPEDLRSLKLKLSAKDSSGPDNREVERQREQVETLIQALGKTIKKARAIREKLKSTGQIGATKRFYGIALLDLLNAGLLSADDRLELQWLKDGPVHKGKISSVRFNFFEYELTY